MQRDNLPPHPKTVSQHSKSEFPGAELELSGGEELEERICPQGKKVW